MLLADVDLTTRDISDLTTADAVTAFLARLGYPTDKREALTPTAFGLTAETADAIRSMELLAEDEERFFRVILLQLRSLTAKARTELARNLGKRSPDHLVILTSDFSVIEFVLIDKETKQRHAPGGGPSVRIIPRVVSVDRKSAGSVERRILRRLTWTGKDGLDQFDKLRSIFQSAHYAEQYFTNRALFADHYLENRLPEDDAWRENPSDVFAQTKRLMQNARSRWAEKDEQTVRDELYAPAWKLLGFEAKVNKSAKDDHLQPDYVLNGPDGKPITVGFVYRWERWLDGPDLNDPDTPEENPGAAVVSALARGDARWIIVTNGKYWRLYSKDAHSRSTNFYEIDLEEALIASDETDPNEAFRYWWLFFRQQAFVGEPEAEQPTCWLDRIVQGSRDYAKRLGDRLKDRIFLQIFPHLAQGFLHDRRKRLGLTRRPSEDELRDTYEATLTLLYRVLFLLYAEARDLLPIGEAAYRKASLKEIKELIAAKAGVAESDVANKLNAFPDNETTLYDHLLRLFVVMDNGDPLLNVPCYNGGLFITEPDGQQDDREQRIARFLLDHKVPDRFLALAIDRLARDQDEKTLGLVFIDYKSLEVRHLGSIYEGLLEFRLKVAEEDLATKTEKKKEKYIPLSQVKVGRGKKKAAPTAAVRKGAVYLSNDKAERKATGSYYTPDPIVEYIVEHTVGPVLEEKLEALKPDLDKAAKTYHRHLTNAKNNPGILPDGSEPRAFAATKTYAEHRALVDQVFDMKVLDPAMGSGHFLVEAVDFITDRLLDFLNRYPHNPVRFMLNKTRRSILDALGDQNVTVDPDKLTDINLLKRHVLKRCIYGVDLNPMAVELAKVSLWLDAFTLGAPLSFLDHHLRCGNSLIGATFEDLKKATSGQLFAIDYEPLLRAINKVLFVNAMADATAAEVHQSADEYAQARKELSGYQIVLDLLVADHFVDSRLKPSKLLQQAHDLDLTTREKLMTSLDARATLLVQQVEAVSRRPDARFFHWEIEFPEVFFDFADSERRHIKHRNDISAGSAGFDAVVGNPPYVRQEAIKEFKEFLKSHYAVFDSTNDLYVYFQELEVSRLRRGGRVGMIVANKWLRAAYGRKVRDFLCSEGHPLELIDFGHAPIFPETDTFPCILVVSRGVTSPDAARGDQGLLACTVPREDWSNSIDLASYLTPRAYRLPLFLMRSEGWSLDPSEVQLLFERLRDRCPTLGEYVGTAPLLGIKTGLNEAFVLDESTRNALMNQHATCESLIKPLVRGRDADRWLPRESHLYLLTIASSENRAWPWSECPDRAEDVFQRTYPSVHQHLIRYREPLKRRQDQGRYWWELRSCDYFDKLYAPKLLIQSIAYHSCFFSLHTDVVPNNSLFFIPTSTDGLLAVLNSSLAWAYMTRSFPHKKDEAIAMDSVAVASLPVPRRLDDSRFGAVVASLKDLSQRRHACEGAFRECLGESYNAQDGITSWLWASQDTFIRRVGERLPRVSGSYSTAETMERASGLRTNYLELLKAQGKIEQRVEALVLAAYGLSEEEQRLVSALRTLRDPISVLRSRSSLGTA